MSNAPVEFLVYLVYCIVGGALFWLRGSSVFERVTGRGKTTADLLWATSMALLAAPLYADTADSLYGFFLLIAAFWAGGRLPWWRSLSLGRNPNEGSHWGAFARHTARGLFWVAPAAFAVGILGGNSLRLAAVGLLAGVSWEVGWRLKEHNPTGPFEATELGELLFGGLIGAAIYSAI